MCSSVKILRLSLRFPIRFRIALTPQFWKPKLPTRASPTDPLSESLVYETRSGLGLPRRFACPPKRGDQPSLRGSVSGLRYETRPGVGPSPLASLVPQPGGRKRPRDLVLVRRR